MTREEAAKKLAQAIGYDPVQPYVNEAEKWLLALTAAGPAPRWTEGELAKAMHAERLEREGCRSNYADERWDESKADRERWYASARIALAGEK